jgi:hypothetical protein
MALIHNSHLRWIVRRCTTSSALFLLVKGLKLADGRFAGKVEVYQYQPTVAPIYNSAMSGVDIGDQKASYYSER